MLENTEKELKIVTKYLSVQPLESEAGFDSFLEFVSEFNRYWKEEELSIFQRNNNKAVGLDDLLPELFKKMALPLLCSGKKKEFDDQINLIADWIDQVQNVLKDKNIPILYLKKIGESLGIVVERDVEKLQEAVSKFSLRLATLQQITMNTFDLAKEDCKQDLKLKNEILAQGLLGFRKELEGYSLSTSKQTQLEYDLINQLREALDRDGKSPSQKAKECCALIQGTLENNPLPKKSKIFWGKALVFLSLGSALLFIKKNPFVEDEKRKELKSSHCFFESKKNLLNNFFENDEKQLKR